MISYERNGTALPLPSGDQRACLLRQAMYSMIVLFHFLQPLLLSAAVARSVIRRLESFGASLRVFDNFNGAESPWVRLIALLDLSETRPLSAIADSMENHQNRQHELPFYKNTVLTGQFNRPVSTA